MVDLRANMLAILAEDIASRIRRLPCRCQAYDECQRCGALSDLQTAARAVEVLERAAKDAGGEEKPQDDA
jgi:hypothetical protein